MLGRLVARLGSLPIPLAVLAGAILLQISEPTIAVRLRNAVFDTYQRWHPRPYQATPVRVVDIDDESLARIGQWPWPRTRLAEMVDALVAAGVSVVAFDVVFAEPDRTAPARIVREWTKEADWLERADALPDPDQAFAAAIERAPAVVGFALTAGAAGDAPAVKASLTLAGDDPAQFLPDLGGVVATIAPLEAPADGNGALNFIADGDGIVRSLPLLFRSRERLYPSLATEALRVMQGARGLIVKSSGSSGEDRFGGKTGIVSVRVGSYVVPTDRQGRATLHFSEPRAERFVPAWKVLDPAESKTLGLEGAIAFVGTSAAGLKDLRFSPLGGTIPGVEVHAQLLEQVLAGGLLVRPDTATGAEVIWTLGVGLALLLLVSRLGPVWSAILGAGAIAAGVALSWLAFTVEQQLFDPLLPGVAAALVYLAASIPREVAAERERRRIRTTFSRYISPNLVEHLINHPDALRLGGERRECSFVMTDLADFTTLVEREQPERIVSLLNEYLDGMIAIVFRHDGTLERIVGDAIVVVFSAPVHQPDHAARAVACALDMDRFAQAFRATQRERGLDVGVTRIGVNSGTVIVGNIGGSAFFDYRALGDAINTAARMETVNKQLGTRVCVSGTTADACPGFVGRPVGTLYLKGKTQPVEAFEPLTPEAAAVPTIAAYREAHRRLAAGDDGAREAFAALAGVDSLAAFHLHRLESGESGATIVLREK